MTEVEICNRALDHAGQREGITSLSQNTPTAKMCNRHYTVTRDRLLRMAPWGFCQAREKLTLHVAQAGTPENPSAVAAWANTLPPPEWAYAYDYPTDCMFLQYITHDALLNSSQNIFPTTHYAAPYQGVITFPSRVGTMIDSGSNIKVIFCNVQNALAQYNRKITDPDLFDPQFVEALELALASKFIMPRTQSGAARQALVDSANQIVIQARVDNANENPDVYDPTPSDFKFAGIADYAQQVWHINSYSELF